jgi:hypothetical protein
MLFRAPVALPPLSVLLADVPASFDQVRTHLAISRRTLQRYVQADQAPRAIMLALFWESRWGLSLLDCELVNVARVHAGHARSLRLESARLRDQLERLVAVADFGCANEPRYAVH